MNEQVAPAAQAKENEAVPFYKNQLDDAEVSDRMQFVRKVYSILAM